MKCEKCGKELEGDLKECIDCSTKVNSKKSNKKIIIIVISILLILVIGILIYRFNLKKEYIEFESQLADGARNYLLSENITLSENEWKKVDIKSILSKKLVINARSSDCTGYVIIQASNMGKTTGEIKSIYTPYIKCKNIYTTENYGTTPSDGLENTDATQTKNDIIKPEITLFGDSEITLNVGDTYKELGAVAMDNVDGDITSKIKISGKVDTKVKGTYEIKYQVSDSAKNKTIIKRIVIVGKKETSVSTQSKNYEYTTSDTGLKLIVNKEIAGWGYNYADEKGEPVFNNYYNQPSYIYKYNDKIYAYNPDSNQYEVYDSKTKKTSQKTTKYIIYNMLENYIQCYDVSSQKVVLLNLNNEVIKEISYVQPDISIQTIHLFKVKEYNPNVKVNTGIYMALYNINKNYGCDLYSINGNDVKLIDGDYCGY